MKKRKPVEFMRELRRRQSNAEEKLWLNIKNRDLDGAKFRRQQPMGRYIVDFISFEAKVRHEGVSCALQKMRVGPSEPPCGWRLQTTLSCCGQKPW